MTLFVIDIDNTISDWTERLQRAGLEPSREPFEEYQKWLNRLQSAESVVCDPAVRGMSDLVWSLVNASELNKNTETRVIYLTARNENLRAATEKWLQMKYFPKLDLFMRTEVDIRSNHEHKRSILKSFYVDNIIVIDDDPNGKMAEVCKAEGWVMLKALVP